MTIAQQLNVKEFPFSIKDKMGNEIYWEARHGYWFKSEHDERGYIIRHEDSKGYWGKCEYDAQGNEIRYDHRRPKQQEYTMDEIAKALDIDVKKLKIKK